MKLLVIAGYAPSLVNFRRELLCSMVARGHEVLALAPVEDLGDVPSQLAGLGVAFRPIRLRRRAMNPVSDWSTLRDIRRQIRAFGPDVVFNYTIKPVIWGSQAAGREGVGQVFSLVTGLGSVFSSTGFKAGLLRSFVEGMYRTAFSFNRAVFFQNPHDEAYFRDRGLLDPSMRTAVVPGSGVDLSRFPQEPVPDGPPVFLMIARLLGQKGVREFVQAARLVKREHPEAVFRLVGPFETGHDAIPYGEVDGWVYEGVIEYLGVAEDVQPDLAMCRVFVLPSYYNEGLPRTILEAMATGRAVVTTDHPGCREPVVEGETGVLVPVRDAEALSAALKGFIVRPEMCADMGRQGRALAESRYDERSVAAQILQEMGL